MSFAVCYACYKLLENSNKKEESKPINQQTYIHDKPIKGRKYSIKSLRKKFSKCKRGGNSL